MATSIKDLLSIYKDYVIKQKDFDNIHYEYEVRFSEKRITKQSYDDIFKNLSQFGFKIKNTIYQLKINSDINPLIRVEIDDLLQIQEYCQTNEFPTYASFVEKTQLLKDNKPSYNEDFGFRTSIQEEKKHNIESNSVLNMKEKWQSSLKTFRYLYRTSLVNDLMPNIRVDMSVLRTNSYDGKSINKSYNFADSNILNELPFCEVEIEIIDVKNIDKNDFINVIEQQLKKTIKYIISAIQKTHYPIPYSKLKDIMKHYTKLLISLNEKRKIHHPYFLGPSSVTLNKSNLSKDSNEIYVKENFCVTDKADGERKLLYILNGKLYFIDTNLSIQYTGVSTSYKGKQIIIDGEHIVKNNNNETIDKYAAFDIYVNNGIDCRKRPFIEDREGKAKENSRYSILNRVMNELKEKLDNNILLDLDVKTFFITTKKTPFHKNCFLLFEYLNSNYYKYNTDGIIITSKYDYIPCESRKITWNKSFKWKPPEYNTIDFLMRIVKNSKGEKQLKKKYVNGDSILYYECELFVGFSDSKHGNLQPQKTLLNLEYGNNTPKKSAGNYYAKQFYPTNPSLNEYCKCHLRVYKDENGLEVIFSKEKDVLEDDTIIEFSYDKSIQNIYEKWIPLRSRHDKTRDYKRGKPNFGNAYHVANDVWQSIHDPITESMLKSSEDIQENKNDDIYYNRKQSKSHTISMRNFHNLYVKKWLIQSVSMPKMCLIDMAVGKSGDLSKWTQSKLYAVLGIDISKDNILNSKDGACVRYINEMSKSNREKLPICMFIHGDTSKYIENGDFEKIDENNNEYNTGYSSHHIMKALMGSRDVKSENLEPFLKKYHGIFENKFDICSIQFAIHYMFEDKIKLHQFLTNVSKYTKTGGYFIGTCYDGKKIYDMLKENDESELWIDKTKIWHIKKKYKDSNETFLNDNVDSLGFKISVYQESINKEFDEYLVNFNFLVKIMNDYGFILVTEYNGGINSFKSLYDNMMKLDSHKIKQYGLSNSMSEQEKKISFLNNYFIFKKQQDIIHSLLQENNYIDYSIGKAKKLSKTIILKNI